MVKVSEAKCREKYIFLQNMDIYKLGLKKLIIFQASAARVLKILSLMLLIFNLLGDKYRK